MRNPRGLAHCALTSLCPRRTNDGQIGHITTESTPWLLVEIEGDIIVPYTKPLTTASSVRARARMLDEIIAAKLAEQARLD
jgi:hypothetical protein